MLMSKKIKMIAAVTTVFILSFSNVCYAVSANIDLDQPDNNIEYNEAEGKFDNEGLRSPCLSKYKKPGNFKKAVDQVALDTQSPMAILLVLVQHCMGLTKEKIFDELETFAAVIPMSVCWLDTNNAIVGMNKRALTDIGGLSIDDFTGKTLYDLYPHELADHLAQHNNEVMQTGKMLSQDGAIKEVTTGEIKYYSISKAPLYDDNGKLVGILGVSVDIIPEEETVSLKLKDEPQESKIDEL